MPNVSTALLEIFGRFDDDGDGALSRKELEAFAIATNGEKFEDEAVDELKKSFNVDANDNLTKRGFLEMYQLQTLSDPNETWRDLIKHGYSVKVQLVRRATGNADPDWKAKQAALEKEREEKEKAEKEAKAKAEKEAKEAAKEKKAAEKAEKAAEKTDKGKAKKNGKAKA
ncbi:hypothetical protein DFJ73DRAFT_850137 [Zopfochytrium polystomum]|nr:hypothetical protein DFJ73DRAFT_850137 [Zopfochytrium polystomum]